uniref:Cyclin-like domain-containing protein n=1 Tax=Parascaris univalens TaxID=6257 RepID=A0A915C191_PARUN
MRATLGMTKNDVLAGVISKASSASTLTDQPHRKAVNANGHPREKGVVDEPPERPTENLKIKPSSFGQRRLYSSINISAEKWLLTLDEKSLAKLENPPSLADGLDRQTEQDLRYLGCEIIQSGAILLRIPQVAAATAQILYQRFYYQRSFVRQHFESTVMACLLLASKIEEAPRRPRDVINVFHRLEHLHGKRTESKKYVPMVLDRNYLDLKNQVIKAERKLLNALGFVVHVRHPHKLIYAYLLALGALDNHELMQKAWSYMNDGLRADIFLRYRPETIACACIYLAARTISKPVALPQQPFPWFEAFDASDRDVKAISLILLKLYTRARAPNWLRLNETLNKIRFGPDSVFAKIRAAESQTQADREMERAKAALEKKKREVARKVLEMQRKESVSKPKSKEGPMREGGDRDRERLRENGRRSASSSSRSRSRSPVEPRKFRSSPSLDRRRRAGSLGRDRGGTHQKHRRHRSRRPKEEKRRARDERRAQKDRRRSRSREERRKVIERDRITNQREREKDVYMALGKRRQESESPEPLAKCKR